MIFLLCLESACLRTTAQPMGRRGIWDNSYAHSAEALPTPLLTRDRPYGVRAGVY
jgi:hypothetical protein